MYEKKLTVRKILCNNSIINFVPIWYCGLKFCNQHELPTIIYTTREVKRNVSTRRRDEGESAGICREWWGNL